MSPIRNAVLIAFLACFATTATVAQEPTYFPTVFNDTETELIASDAFPTYEPTYPSTASDSTYSPTEGGTVGDTEATTAANSTEVLDDDALDDDLFDDNATRFDDDDDVNATEIITDDDVIDTNETAADDVFDVANSTEVIMDDAITNGDDVNATDDAVDFAEDDRGDGNATAVELVTSSPVASLVTASPTVAPAAVEPEGDITTAPTYVTDPQAVEVTLPPTPAITRGDNGTEEEAVEEEGLDDEVSNSTEPIFTAASAEANGGSSVMAFSFGSRLMIWTVGVGAVSVVSAFIAE
ncbi:hypothetical protein ACHAXS_012461 [Conticribra weissflogii]